MRYLIIAAIACLSLKIYGQDTIFQKSGTTIIVDILSESNKDITYTIWGKSFPKTINHSDITRIGYFGKPPIQVADYPTGVLKVDRQDIPSDLKYMTVRGVLYPQRFYYKVDCAFPTTMGDMSFSVNGVELKFRSPMDIVRYLDNNNWEFVSINTYSATYGDYATVVSEMLFKRRQP